LDYSIFLTIYALTFLAILAAQGVILHVATVQLTLTGASPGKSARVLAMLAIIWALLFTAIAFWTKGDPSQPFRLFILLFFFGPAIAVVKSQYKAKILHCILVVLAMVIASAVLSTVAQTHFVQAFKSPTGSMSPGLEMNDHFLVSKYAYKGSDPSRGDIVVFKYPKNPDVSYVKRILGFPGEKIEMKDGAVFIDGIAIDDPWGKYKKSGPPLNKKAQLKNFKPILIPSDEYFVLGDSRGNSVDSRHFGTISKDLFIGKAMVRYWPLSRRGHI